MTQAKDVLQVWIDGINTADVQKLLSLYDKDAVLIPTFSNSNFLY